MKYNLNKEMNDVTMTFDLLLTLSGERLSIHSFFFILLLLEDK